RRVVDHPLRRGPDGALLDAPVELLGASAGAEQGGHQGGPSRTGASVSTLNDQGEAEVTGVTRSRPERRSALPPLLIAGPRGEASPGCGPLAAGAASRRPRCA